MGKTTHTEELAAKVSTDGARSMRAFTLRELKTLCTRIEKAGGKPNTVVRVVRESRTGDIRLRADIDK